MTHVKELHLIPTTHWDRAWYWPLQRMRVKLIEMFQSVMVCMRQDPQYQFMMDGQAVMLEDYLEVCPEDRQELMGYVQAGRLQIGPLYVLPDSYCTGGESLIRNYLFGSEIAEQMGGTVPRMMHMPDSFGFIPSMPMLVQGLGLDSFAFMRGVDGNVDPELRLFQWSCPDGSCIPVLRLQHGYGNAAFLGRKNPGILFDCDIQKAVPQLLECCDTQVDGYPKPYVLFAGIDHHIPQKELSEIREQANTENSDYHIQYSNWDNVVEDIVTQDMSDWVQYSGELHGHGAASILGGTVTARIQLKIKNAEIERALCSVVEPLDAAVALLGGADPAGKVLRAAWKNLLKVHPHDDITGCSVDKVHDDDEYLLGEAEDAADAVRRRMIHTLQEVVGGYEEGENRYGFFIVNLQPYARTCRFAVTCDAEGRQQWGDEQLPEHFILVDEAGTELPACELERGISEEHPHAFIRLEGSVKLPAMSIQRYYLQPCEVSQAHCHQHLENNIVRVTVQKNGSFDVLHKQTGQSFDGVSLFSNQGDIGDSYDFCDIIGDHEQLFTNASFDLTEMPSLSGYQILRLTGELIVPQTSDRKGRSAEKVSLPMKITLSLAPDSADVHVEYAYTNTAADHRLRLNILPPFPVTEVRAGIKYNEVTTAVYPQPEPAQNQCDAEGLFDATIMGKQKKDFRVHPEFTADHFIAVENELGGLAIMPECPVNYELVDGEQQRLAITIVRAIGKLSRGDMTTRTNPAGPDITVSGAQLLGKQITMRFTYRPYAASEKADIFRQSVLHRMEPATGLIEGFGRSRVSGKDLVTCSIDNEALILSAFKITHKRDAVLIRFFNPTPSEQQGYLTSCAHSLSPCGLNEKRLTEEEVLWPCDGRFKLTVPAYGLRSFLMELPESIN